MLTFDFVIRRGAHEQVHEVDVIAIGEGRDQVPLRETVFPLRYE